MVLFLLVVLKLHIDMELVTAVLSGTRTLEIRIFSTIDVSMGTEKTITRRLCRAMDLFDSKWQT